MEGDSKICLDALSKDEEPSDWSISSITWDTAVLSVFFDNCKFCWVKRSLNSAAHSTAKYVVALKAGFLCNNYDLLPPILPTSFQDRGKLVGKIGVPFVFLLSLMNWLVIKKKKKKITLFFSHNIYKSNYD